MDNILAISSRRSINTKASKLAKIQEMSIRDSKTRYNVSHSDPFDSMIFKANAHPKLPPVLSKHFKNYSSIGLGDIDNSNSERYTTNTISCSRSQIKLPKLTMNRISEKFNTKKLAKFFYIVEKEGEDKIDTPYFSNGNNKVPAFKRQSKFSKKQIRQSDICELSFGN